MNLHYISPNNSKNTNHRLELITAILSFLNIFSFKIKVQKRRILEGLRVPFKEFVLTTNIGIQNKMFKDYKTKPDKYYINRKVLLLLSIGK